MTDLFDLAAPADPRALRHKIFFAIRPEADAADRILKLADRRRLSGGLGGWPTPAERLHISLNGLGGHGARPEGLIAAATQAMAGFVWPSFVVALDRFGSWGRGGGKRALVLWGDDGLIGVRRLHEAVHERLVEADLTRGRARTFDPHLTLLRDQAVVAERAVQPISWRVREVLLLESLHGEGRQEVLGRWSLGATHRL